MFIRNERNIQEFLKLYPITSIIIGIQVILYILTDFTPMGSSIKEWGIGRNIYIEYGQYWRLFTSIFLHGGLSHILFNSFALVLFAPALESMLGKLKFIITFLLTGLAGNIATFLLIAHPLTGYLGSSGAIYGLFGLYIFMAFFRKHLIDHSSKQIVITIFIIGLVMTFIMPNINMYAHIFGFLIGVALGPVMLIGAQPFTPKGRRRVVIIGRKTGRKPPAGRQGKSLFSLVLWIVIGVLLVAGLIGKFFM